MMHTLSRLAINVDYSTCTHATREHEGVRTPRQTLNTAICMGQRRSTIVRQVRSSQTETREKQGARRTWRCDDDRAEPKLMAHSLIPTLLIALGEGAYGARGRTEDTVTIQWTHRIVARTRTITKHKALTRIAC